MVIIVRQFLHLRVLLLPLLMSVPFASGIGCLQDRLMQRIWTFPASNGAKRQTKELLMLVTLVTIATKQKATEVRRGMGKVNSFISYSFSLFPFLCVHSVLPKQLELAGMDYFRSLFWAFSLSSQGPW